MLPSKIDLFIGLPSKGLIVLLILTLNKIYRCSFKLYAGLTIDYLPLEDLISHIPENQTEMVPFNSINFFNVIKNGTFDGKWQLKHPWITDLKCDLYHVSNPQIIFVPRCL